jgi:predicted acetyltransferase
MPAQRVAYRRIAGDEKIAAMAVIGLAFGNPAQAREWAAPVDADQLRALEVDGELASVLRVSLLSQFWLGRPVPSAQVLSLATSPEHGGRGRGLALLQGLFAELREAGVPTVTLQPSTARFYRSAGFEFAGAWNRYELACRDLPPPGPAYHARRLAPDDVAPMAKLYDQIAPTRHGAFAREEWWWRGMLSRTRHQESKETANFLLENSAGPVGWAMVAFGEDPVPANQSFALRLRIQDWGWLPGHDLAAVGALSGYRTLEGVIGWSGPDPDPLLFLLPNEAIRLVRRSHWMLRLVDLAAALGARPYPPDAAGRVDLRVDDPLCPWNSGAWTLEVEHGHGRLERKGAAGGPAGAATTSIRGLAALFTGFATPDELARVGLLDGVDSTGLALLGRAFASPEPFTAEPY